MDLREFLIELINALAWPMVVFIAMYWFKSELQLLLKRLGSVKIGDNSIDFFQTELEKAQDLSLDVRNAEVSENKVRFEMSAQIPLTDANAQVIKQGLRPSPSGLDLEYYRELADRDPALALAGLRIELEIIGHNLAKGFNVPVSKARSVNQVYRELAIAGAISSKQLDLVQSIAKLANAAVHGAPVTRDDANDVIDTADVLRDQYLSWLSWGFNDES